jgi:hypothetical protein
MRRAAAAATMCLSGCLARDENGNIIPGDFPSDLTTAGWILALLGTAALLVLIYGAKDRYS